MDTLNLEQEIEQFLEHNCGCVAVNAAVTLNGCTVNGTIDITLCSTLSRLDHHHELNVLSIHPGYANLIETFGLRSVKDLGKITVNMLHPLYFEEKAVILCTVLKDDYTLIFRKKGNTTIVSDERDETIAVIEEVYRDNNAFVNYTLGSFQGIC